VLRFLLEFLLGVPLRGEVPLPVLRCEARLLREPVLGPEVQIAVAEQNGRVCSSWPREADALQVKPYEQADALALEGGVPGSLSAGG
jgi:hypothetical protein